MPSSLFITTSIPYVNASPHVGHAQEFALADLLAREHRRAGAHVILQSGTDDNASKNVIAAKKAGRSVRDHIEEQGKAFRELLARLEITPDRFVRTSSVEHAETVRAFWKRLDPQDLERRPYSGLYCTGCEDFLDPSHAGVCPDHRTQPETVKEENVFFRLSRYESEILAKIESDELRVRPLHRRNEVLAFLKRGLKDISLTRPASRSDGWGIPAPGCEGQIVYVWIDALVNYLTGAGLGINTDGLWTKDVRKIHVIGKNIVKFHAIYWPALLLSAGLPLPDEILVHGFLTTDGVKISKSLGNGIDPLALLERQGSAAVRHTLLYGLSVRDDADFSEKKVAGLERQDLANRLGNLLNRVVSLRAKAGLHPAVVEIPKTVVDLTLLHELELRDFGSLSIWQKVDALNTRIQVERPWGWLDSRPAQIREWIAVAERELTEVLGAFSSWCPEAAAEGLRILRGERPARPLFRP